jgi:hypothetical protein
VKRCARRASLRPGYRAAQQRVRPTRCSSSGNNGPGRRTFFHALPISVYERGPGLEANGAPRLVRKRRLQAVFRPIEGLWAPYNNSLQRTHRQSLRSFLFAAELGIVRLQKAPIVNTALLEYIRALSAGREASHSPEERVAYTKQLAEAARIVEALESGALSALSTLVEAETRANGYVWFEGAHGEAVASAFARFARSIRP